MVAETVMKYRGVLCFHCHRPIPLSARVASVDAKLRRGDLTNAEEIGPRAFSLRCRSCHREGMYFGTQFIDCEGEPPSRQLSPRSASREFRLSNEAARAASGCS
jgi:hypothetical protein